MKRTGALTELAEQGRSTASTTQQHEWQASFIAAQPALPQGGTSPLLRREFELPEAAASATLRVTALGVYEIFLNGVRASDELLAPGWTSYAHRLTYRTLDVASLLRPGTNVIGVVLADGWFRGRLGFHGGKTNIYGGQLALLAELEVTGDSGTQTHIASDSSWLGTTGPTLSSSLYDGETYDARLELDGWMEPGFDATDWARVHEVHHDLKVVVPATSPPIRAIEEITVVDWWRSSSGAVIVDFGQNLAGHVRISVAGNAGDTVRIRHAEVLDGRELCTRPLRSAIATDTYVLRGGALETWEPHFTYHGFRYAEIDGWPADFDPASVRAVVVHSDMRRIGWFDCSDPLLNKLHDNAVWGMRGNAVSIPTDCPQRDERLGWTGDVNVFSPAAAYLYDVRGFLGSWLDDLAAEQRADGSVNHLVPDVMPLLPDVPFGLGGAAGWGDAAVSVPWVLYLHYGEREVLEARYPSMCAWVDYVASRAGADHLWTGDWQFGDWLDPSAPADRPERGYTDPDLVATAHFARSARLLSRAASALGRAEDSSRYSQLAEQVGDAFRGRYLSRDFRLSSDSQAAYALALEFDLLPLKHQRATAAARLAELVREAGHRIATGFLATPVICDALANNGYVDDAYALLLQTECPSWLYQVRQGATTIWERWDSLLPDGTVNPGDMTSFNHFAFGAVVDWMHRSVAGLAPMEPGYSRVRVRPLIGGGLTRAKARHESPRGLIEVAWELADAVLSVAVSLPDGTTAVVELPGSDSAVEVTTGSHSWQAAWPSEMVSPERVTT